MAKAGRPKAENPIERKISVKFSNAGFEELSQYAKEHEKAVAQVIREAVYEYMHKDRKQVLSAFFSSYKEERNGSKKRW